MTPPATAAVAAVLVTLVYATAAAGAGMLVLRSVSAWERIPQIRGTLSSACVAFVVGQGVLGAVWLVLALQHRLTAAAVWIVTATGWVCLFAGARRWPWGDAPSDSDRPDGFYRRLRVGILLLVVLRGLGSLLPTRNDDALTVYLVAARAIAASHALRFEPSVALHHQLMPLQSELHGAALFAISNEAAVTLWDFLCGAAVLALVYLLARAVSQGTHAASTAVFMMATTAGFITLAGAGKADITATQFGFAAFLWLLLGPPTRAALFLSGLSLGWALASRYSSAILVPAWLFALYRLYRRGPAPALWGALLAFMPMLIKNWILIGEPLAPMLGDPDRFWLWHEYESNRNLAWSDLALYPLVWSFGERAHMLGNASPLYLGFLPFWFSRRRSAEVGAARPALVLGALILVTWLLLEPRTLHTRWLLVPLALLAVGLAPAFVAADAALQERPRLRLWERWGLGVLLAFWLAASAWGAVQSLSYLAGRQTRAQWYARKAAYDVADWLNRNVGPRERVALRNLTKNRYFLGPSILDQSESAEELQAAWELRRTLTPQAWSAEDWRLANRGRYRYVVFPNADVAASLATHPSHRSGTVPSIAFAGREFTVVEVFQEPLTDR